MFNARLVEAAEALQASRDKAALVGLASDVIYLENQLAALAGVPIEPVRESLDRHGVVLPPRVLTSAALSKNREPE